MQERLQKILARGGLASRRAAEQWIEEGRVRVNGRVVTELGAKADPRADKIEVDGKRVVAEDFVYAVLHKPRGVVSTLSDPEGRPTVQEYIVKLGARVYPVGRLDFATSGVLLVTNDGAFADGLLHPKRAVPKTYVVKVNGVMQPADLKRWEGGVRLEDGAVTGPATATLIRHEGDKTWFELTISEGRNQQIRRMGVATGFSVMRLSRVSFAGVTGEGLRPGSLRMLTQDELRSLREAYGVPKKVRAPRMLEDDAPKKGRVPRPRNLGAAPAAESGVREGRGPKAEGRGPKAEGRGSRTEGRGPKAEGRGPRTEGRGPKAEGRGPRTEGRGSRTEGRGPRTEGRGPKAEGRGPRTEGRGPKAEGRGPRTEGRRGRSEERAPRGGEREGRASRGARPRGEEAGQQGGPRYGGGSPGRRRVEVREDWGGGSERGRAPSRAEGSARPGRGSSTGRGGGGEGPRGPRSRTTGSGGGIGGDPSGDYRLSKTRRRR